MFVFVCVRAQTFFCSWVLLDVILQSCLTGRVSRTRHAHVFTKGGPHHDILHRSNQAIAGHERTNEGPQHKHKANTPFFFVLNTQKQTCSGFPMASAVILLSFAMRSPASAGCPTFVWISSNGMVGGKLRVRFVSTFLFGTFTFLCCLCSTNKMRMNQTKCKFPFLAETF